MTNSAINNVIDMLDQSHAALLSGRISQLGALTEVMENAVRAIGSQSADATHLNILRSKADRVSKLLEAAHKGLRLAKTRQATLSDTVNGMSTYTADGVRQATVTKARFEKRS